MHDTIPPFHRSARAVLLISTGQSLLVMRRSILTVLLLERKNKTILSATAVWEKERDHFVSCRKSFVPTSTRPEWRCSMVAHGNTIIKRDSTMAVRPSNATNRTHTRSALRCETLKTAYEAFSSARRTTFSRCLVSCFMAPYEVAVTSTRGQTVVIHGCPLFDDAIVEPACTRVAPRDDALFRWGTSSTPLTWWSATPSSWTKSTPQWSQKGSPCLASIL